MLSDLSNLLKYFVRFLFLGGCGLLLLLWLLPTINTLLPILLGILPIALIAWAFTASR